MKLLIILRYELSILVIIVILNNNSNFINMQKLFAKKLSKRKKYIMSLIMHG